MERSMGVRIRTAGLLWMAVAIALTNAAASGAASDPESSCPKWFPDFRCERSGRWDGFHRPNVQPYLFEDPFITTGLNLVYIWHDFPGRSVFGDGEAHVVALQARVALTDRLAFIATKDGYMWNRPDQDLGGTNLLNDTQGHMNLAAGFKYALIQDRERGFIVSPALRIEVPSGSTDTLQGHADGILIPSVSGAWGRDRLRLMGDLGAQIPIDGGQQSSSIFYHLYASFDLHERLVPFAQLSGITWVHSGDGQIPVPLKIGGELPLDTAQNALGTGRFEGADVINLGSRGVAGQDYWTWALGAHVPISDHVTFGVAYERPFSHQRGITKQRVTTNFNFEF